jgi:hypothetical protein
MMQCMPATLEQTGTNVITPRSAFILRFISTIALWTIALLIMFSGYEILFWLLISVFGLIGLLEFYRMLDHKGLPNFQGHGNDLRRRFARRQFFTTSPRLDRQVRMILKSRSCCFFC